MYIIELQIDFVTFELLANLSLGVTSVVSVLVGDLEKVEPLRRCDINLHPKFFPLRETRLLFFSSSFSPPIFYSEQKISATLEILSETNSSSSIFFDENVLKLLVKTF